MMFQSKASAWIRAERRLRPLLCSAPLWLAACERERAWDEPFVRGDAVGLSAAVAVVDRGRDELMLLGSPGENQLTVRRLHVGKNIVATVPTLDRELLLVLTRGIVPRLRAGDERPVLSVISGRGDGRVLNRYELDDPLGKLVLDPEGEWAVAYEAEGAVVNLSELILVHLSAPEEPPIPLTIRSSGGTPRRFTFTSALTVEGGGAHRLLVIETEQNLSIIDLENPTAAETYVPLPSGTSAKAGQPVQVVYHDDLESDAQTASYLAVRLANDSNVLTLRLAPPKPGSSAAFSLINNILDAGAHPSTIDFVETESGLRLAALVPSRNRAVLFDPDTSKSEVVEFDRPYTGMARITGLVGESPDVGDVALLYSDSAPSIAFWQLAQASNTPYASFEHYAVQSRVSQVIDVPGGDFAHLKLLTEQSGSGFFLLDLKSRLSHPMRALSGFSLRLAPDGRRAWAFAPGALQLAQLDFGNKHPASVAVERPVLDVFDIERTNGSGRTLIALHGSGSSFDDRADLGATLFDALEPDSAESRFYSGLALEGW